MIDFQIAIAVRIFPNPVQTYILRQLAGFRKAGAEFVILADRLNKSKEHPPIIDEYDLDSNVCSVGTSRWQLLRAILSIPLSGQTFWKAAGRIVKSSTLAELGPKYRVKSILRLKTSINSKFDVIHSHSLFSSLDLLFYKLVFGIPIVSTYHGQVPRGVKRLSKSHLRIVLDNVDVFLVNTKFARQELESLGCASSKIQIIPQGIELSEYPLRRREITRGDPVRILTVGRLSIEKGHHIALQSIAKCLDSNTSIEYHVVGSGPERSALKQLSESLSIDKNVVFHGFQSDEALKQLYSDSHLFLLPSIDTGDGFHVETQGVVLQEAQAQGIPVVASRTGGIPEVIDDGETGILFAEGDVDALADAISELVDDSSLYERFAKNGRTSVEQRFDVKLICNKQFALYKHLVDKS